VPAKLPLGGAVVGKRDNELGSLGSRTKIALIDIKEGQMFMILKSLKLWTTVGLLNL